jgi:hypothetical protein
VVALVFLMLFVVVMAVGVTRRPASLYRVYMKVFGPVETRQPNR